MAGATGLEPATSGVTGRRSNQLSYSRMRMTAAESWDLKGPPFQVKKLSNPVVYPGFLRCRCKKRPICRQNRRSLHLTESFKAREGRFRAKACPALEGGWTIRVTKTRQNKRPEPSGRLIGMEKARCLSFQEHDPGQDGLWL
jgi:hypothetical protein